MSSFSFFIFSGYDHHMIPQLFCNPIPCAEILLNDNEYHIRPTDNTLPDSNLKKNICQTGILHPPLLQKITDKSYIILSGRKRILAGISLGMREIPCLIMAKQANSMLKWQTILSHALIGSRLSIIEQAIFFSKAEPQLTIEEQLDLLPLLNLKPQQYILQELAKYLTLAPITIHALHTGILQEKIGKKLVKLCFDDQEMVVNLVRYYKLGGSKQKKLVSSAIDLVMRSGRPFREILDTWERKHPAKASNRPQRAMALLSWLESQCFPGRTSAQKEFEKFQRQLHMPGNAGVRPSPSFEDETLTLSLTFNNKHDFLRNWEAIQNILMDAKDN